VTTNVMRSPTVITVVSISVRIVDWPSTGDARVMTQSTANSAIRLNAASAPAPGRIA
jgi:hypothetical protein